jgi:hypothetical protein
MWKTGNAVCGGPSCLDFSEEGPRVYERCFRRPFPREEKETGIIEPEEQPEFATAPETALNNGDPVPAAKPELMKTEDHPQAAPLLRF